MSTTLEPQQRSKVSFRSLIAVGLALLGIVLVFAIFWLGALLSLGALALAWGTHHGSARSSALALGAIGIVLAVIIGLFLTPVDTRVEGETEPGQTLPGVPTN